MRTRAVLTHAAQAIAEGALIALLVVGLAAGTTFAAKGGNANKPGGGGSNTGGSLSVVMVRDANGNGLPNYMDDITFNVPISTTSSPFVGLRCYQGTNFVLDGYVGYFEGYLFNPWFTLASGYWDPAIAASCTARLFTYDNRGREHVTATTTFGVDP